MQLKINFLVCLFCNDKRRLIATKTVIKRLSNDCKDRCENTRNLYVSF